MSLTDQEKIFIDQLKAQGKSDEQIVKIFTGLKGRGVVQRRVRKEKQDLAELRQEPLEAPKPKIGERLKSGFLEGVEQAEEAEKAVRQAQASGDIGAGRAFGENLMVATNKVMQPVAEAINSALAPAVQSLGEATVSAMDFATKPVQYALDIAIPDETKMNIQSAVISPLENALAQWNSLDEPTKGRIRNTANFVESGLFLLDALALGSGLGVGTKSVKTAAKSAAKDFAQGFEAGLPGGKSLRADFAQGFEAGLPIGEAKRVEGAAGAESILDNVRGAFKDSEVKVDNFIDTNIEKAIRPSVAGKGKASDIAKYKEQARDAVKAITLNKERLKLTDEFGEAVDGLPKSLQQFADAIEQTRGDVYRGYTALAEQAGQDFFVDVTTSIPELERLKASPVLEDFFPEAIQYLDSRVDILEKRGAYSILDAQDAVKKLNESLQAYYKNPSSESYTKAAVDAMVANNIRKSLDETIGAATGAEYQQLKNLYGSLKAIEKDVINRTIVEGRKNAKGLVDFTDIFSAGDVLAGVATANPALVAKGGAMVIIKNWIKSVNDPNKRIEAMFKRVGRLLEGEANPIPSANKVKPAQLKTPTKSKIDSGVKNTLDELASVYNSVATPEQSISGMTPFEESMARVWEELSIAEAGQRIFTEDGVTSIKSTFPEWIPEGLRRKELLGEVIEYLDPTNPRYPRKDQTRLRELIDAVYEKIDADLGVDTSSIRNILKQT